MLTTAEGIVLKQRKIAGNRRMIVIFTRRFGKISAGTSLNEKSRNKAALALRPFTYAEYDFFKGRETYNINSASVRKSYYSIGEDLNRFMTASVFIDYLDKILQEEEPMPGLYDLAMEFLDVISVTRGKGDTLLYAFIVKSFRMLGIMPELKCCVNCGKPAAEFGYDDAGLPQGNRRFKQFSVSSGGIICGDCAERENETEDALLYRPSFDIIDVLSYFSSRPLETFGKAVLKKEISESIRTILSDYTRLYLGADVLGNFKELEV